MKASKNKNVVFACQFDEKSLRLVKCSLDKDKRELLSAQYLPLPDAASDNELGDIIADSFKKMSYGNNTVILSLPRNQAAGRYFKFPAQADEEIDRIISLQAHLYLPYPAEELAMGYEKVFLDDEGYTRGSLVIVRLDIIERCLNILKRLHPGKLVITLSSYGICNLYNYLKQDDNEANVIAAIDNETVELAVTYKRKLIFSRSFNINPADGDWQFSLADQIRKTLDLYEKETALAMPSKIVFLNSPIAAGEGFPLLLQDKAGLPVEVLAYDDKIKLPGDVSAYKSSFTGLIGLSLAGVPESLNLTPTKIKESNKKKRDTKEFSNLSVFAAAAVVILAAGMFKNFDNKNRYLKYLNSEILKIEPQARELEKISKRFKALESGLNNKQSGLDILYEAYKIMPQEISLSQFTFQEDKQVSLQGITADFDSVFKLVGLIEKSAQFKDFVPKVKYATKKKFKDTQMVDFEIQCLRK